MGFMQVSRAVAMDLISIYSECSFNNGGRNTLALLDLLDHHTRPYHLWCHFVLLDLIIYIYELLILGLKQELSEI